MAIQDSTNSMPFSTNNPAAGNQPQIYVGVSAVLNVTINNATGGSIKVVPGASPSEIEIYMPVAPFFTTQQVSQMTITNISQAGWTFSYNSADVSLMLTYTGAAPLIWSNTESLTFDINNVTSNASPTISQIQANMDSFVGLNIPGQLYQNLALANPVAPTNIDLTTVLQLNLGNQGAVFVSVEADPLNNTIFLTLKNTGTNPLYNDSVQWTIAPTVTVSFVYGSTSGALAPYETSGSPSLGSAWLISASLASSSSGWGYQNPTPGQTQPLWILSPSTTNQEVIGTYDDANVTFVFSNIASFTPVGHTQMYLQFSNFMANSTTPYNSPLYVLDISKQTVPPTRGLTGFSSPNNPLIALTTPQNNITIPLSWSMFYVDNISLVCNIPGVALMTKNYYSTTMPALNYDSFSLVIPIQVSLNTPVFITIQAFDNAGNYLNSMQFTVFITASFFVDPAGKQYPTLFINNQTWLGGNYSYNSGAGSIAYGNNGGNQATYGLLYTQAAAQTNIPPGWRIPTQADWQGLLNFLGTSAYQALMSAGSGNFSAQLGGYCDNQNNFSDLAANGHYWSSTPNTATPGNDYKLMLFSTNQSVSVAGSFPASYFLSVRYVRNS